MMTIVPLPSSLNASRCATCPVRMSAICGHADDKSVAELSRLTRNVQFERGQSIIVQGDEAQMSGILTEGVVKIVLMTEDGDSQILGLLFPGDFVGRAYEKYASVSYEAATDVTLCSVNLATFERILARSPELEHGYLLATLQQVDMMRSWTCLLRGRTSKERVAAYILFEYKMSGLSDAVIDHSGNLPVLELKLSRSDLASVLDMTPETFCRCLHVLADDGAVKVLKPHRIEITNAGLLKSLTGPPIDGLVEQLQSASA